MALPLMFSLPPEKTPASDPASCDSVRITMRFITLLLFATLSPAHAGDLDDLAARLGHDDPAVREEAQEALADIDPDRIPEVEALRSRTTDPEVRGRLAAALDALRLPRLRRDLDSAIREAVRKDKPVLVICGHGIEDATTIHPRVVKEINASWVAVWAALPQQKEQIRFYFATPQGFVRYLLTGARNADAMLRELEFARECVRATEEEARRKVGEARAMAAAAVEVARSLRDKDGMGDAVVDEAARRLLSLQDAHSQVGLKLGSLLKSLASPPRAWSEDPPIFFPDAEEE